jgi:DNA-binding beta-propeller fold protein YncE
MIKTRLAWVLLVMLMLALPATAQDSELTLTPIGTYETGIFDEGAQEIGSYDVESQRLFITNADANVIDILDISDPSTPTRVDQISLDDFGDSINSVAAQDGLVVAAVEGPEIDSIGQLVFMDTDGTVLASYEAGVLPDMVGFSPDGAYAVVANEGEPNDEYTLDPEGSVTIIDISGGVEDASVMQVGFTAFNADGERADELPADVRIFGPDATVAQDLEPEYVTFSPDSSTAFVSMQENNAIAVIDLTSGDVVRIIVLGFKDYSLEENAIDPSNEDGEINMRPVPVVGMYQPDSIAAYEANGETYILTANEGDARDYDGFSEEERIADITLDSEAFPNAEDLQQESNLGRLLITTTLGDTDGDGAYEELYNYGARSFSIFTPEGELVYDSNNAFATYFAENLPEVFNSQGTTDSFDNRSDDKGIEPEGISIGIIGDQTYAFITLERVGGVMVYNITDPENATFAAYANNANIDGNPEEGTAGDIGPEIAVFISAEDSPTGTPLLAVMNEVSGSTTIYEITQNMGM